MPSFSIYVICYLSTALYVTGQVMDILDEDIIDMYRVLDEVNVIERGIDYNIEENENFGQESHERYQEADKMLGEYLEHTSQSVNDYSTGNDVFLEKVEEKAIEHKTEFETD